MHTTEADRKRVKNIKKFYALLIKAVNTPRFYYNSMAKLSEKR